MVRGEIWWASLSQPQGSEPGYRRPVLVMQSDAFNRSKISTVVCLIITSNINLAKAPGNVRISKGESKLPKESVVNVSRIVTLDKSYLADCVGALSSRLLGRVENGMKLVLGLE